MNDILFEQIERARAASPEAKSGTQSASKVR
jgi:hypothetical protein